MGRPQRANSPAIDYVEERLQNAPVGAWLTVNDLAEGASWPRSTINEAARALVAYRGAVRRERRFHGGMGYEYQAT